MLLDERHEILEGEGLDLHVGQRHHLHRHLIEEENGAMVDHCSRAQFINYELVTIELALHLDGAAFDEVNRVNRLCYVKHGIIL